MELESLDIDGQRLIKSGGFQRRGEEYMTLKQISAVKVGDKYDIVVFGLTIEGEVYALHTHAAQLNKGEWIKLPTLVKKGQ